MEQIKNLLQKINESQNTKHIVLVICCVIILCVILYSLYMYCSTDVLRSTSTEITTNIRESSTNIKRVGEQLDTIQEGLRDSQERVDSVSKGIDRSQDRVGEVLERNKRSTSLVQENRELANELRTILLSVPNENGEKDKGTN